MCVRPKKGGMGYDVVIRKKITELFVIKGHVEEILPVSRLSQVKTKKERKKFQQSLVLVLATPLSLRWIEIGGGSKRTAIFFLFILDFRPPPYFQG